MNEEYSTYNGLNRPAMVMGVPLMLLLSLGGSAILLAFGGMYFFGGAGLLFPLPLVFVLVIVRVICETDPNGIRVLSLNLKGHFLKVKHADTVIGFSSTRRIHAKH